MQINIELSESQINKLGYLMFLNNYFKAIGSRYNLVSDKVN